MDDKKYIKFTVYKDGKIIECESVDMTGKSIEHVLDYIEEVRRQYHNEIDKSSPKTEKEPTIFRITYKYGDADHCLVGEI